MNKAILAALMLGLFGLTGFNTESVNYEQVAFDYFLADILRTDFKEISKVEFKGETENTYSTLGDYKVCLKPAEKLQSLIKGVAKGSTTNIKDITYDEMESMTIAEFKPDSPVPKLYVYPAVRVADKYYVFIALRSENYGAGSYVFELNVDGKNIRSCRMN